MSKRIIVFLTLAFVLVAASSSMAWEYSFRGQASGMLLWGDFDNDLDPIYIFDNKGNRIYTTLSNLTDGDNEFFETSVSDDTYLFGTSGQFGLPSKFPWESRTSFVIELADETWADYTGLDTDYNGGDDLFGYGEMEGTWVYESGWATDTGYTYRNTISGTAKAIDIAKRRDWQLTHAYTDGNKTLGFSFQHRGYGDNYDEDSWRSYDFAGNWWSGYNPDESYSYTKSIISTNNPGTTPWVEFRGSRTGEFSDIEKEPTDIFKVSFEMPFNPIPNSEVRFDIVYSKFTDERDINDFVGFTEMYNDTLSPDYDTTISSERWTSTDKQNGSGFMPGIQLTKNWAPETYSWFRVDFGFGSQDQDYSWTHTLNAHEFDYSSFLTYGDVQDWNYTETYTETGEADISMFSFYHKTVHEFNENFRFAAGLEFAKFKWESKDLAYTRNFSRYDAYYDSTSTFNDINDNRRTRTETESGTRSSVEKSTMLTLPVAMEYVQGRWTFRLGAVHYIEKWEEEDTFAESGTITYTDVTEYGNDSTLTPAATPPNESVRSYSETATDKWHWNEFRYGLEFRANDNLKVELSDFLRSDSQFNNTRFFRNLRMSLTVLW